MLRRGFLSALLKLPALLALPRPAAAARPAILLQNAPLAGFQFHAGEAVWPMLRLGAPLTLVRESDNPYDARAVRVEWQGRKLGYLPADENAAVAQLLDRGARLQAHISALRESRNPWKRVAMEIHLIADRT